MERADFIDSRFKESWTGARKVDLAVGAYHFFTLCRSGEEQAENFIKTVSSDTPMLPPAIDLEFTGNCKARPDTASFLKELEFFKGRIVEVYGMEPVVYTTGSFYRQYADNARIRGISGRVDLNVLNENADLLQVASVQ